jgi:hypothetical protein
MARVRAGGARKQSRVGARAARKFTRSLLHVKLRAGVGAGRRIRAAPIATTTGTLEMANRGNAYRPRDARPAAHHARDDSPFGSSLHALAIHV